MTRRKEGDSSYIQPSLLEFRSSKQDSNEAVQDSQPQDKKRIFRNVREGTFLYSGPFRKRGTVVLGRAQTMLTVEILSRDKGSIYCRVDKPPEYEGDIFWVSDIPGTDTGYRRT